METTRIWYTVGLNGPQEEHPVNCEDAQRITHEYIAQLKEIYETDAELIRDSCFGFCVDKDNFLEISLDSKAEYRIRFECRTEKSLIGIKRTAIFSQAYKSGKVADLDNLIHHFFALDLDQFKLFITQQNLSPADAALRA